MEEVERVPVCPKGHELKQTKLRGSSSDPTTCDVCEAGYFRGASTCLDCASAERAAAAGVRVTHHHYDGAEHGFACGMGMTPEAEQALQQISSWRHSLDV